MSPLSCMQTKLELSSDLELTLKMEKFIKEYVSLIWPLLTIFTVAVGRILTNIQLQSWLCSGHRVQNNFCSKWKTLIISQILHTLMKSLDQKHILLWWCTLGTYSTFINHFADNPEHFDLNAMCLSATATLLSELMSPKLVGRCANTKGYHILQTDCSWMLAVCPHCA